MKKLSESARARAGMVRAIAVVANLQKSRATQEMPRLRVWLKTRRIAVVEPNAFHRADLILTLGGDGTILAIAPEAARLGIPVLGVNVGRLGFMTGADVAQLYPSLEACLAGTWRASERLMLEIEMPRARKLLYALNDAVIRVGSTPRVITVFAMVGKEELGHFTGDGVIVATPTGSTAYSLAAQGPVVHPNVEALILNPICAHSFSQRPVVFPSDQTLTLELRDLRPMTQVQLCLDGQRVFSFRAGDRIDVRRAPFKLKLLQNPRSSYFGVLKEKLFWGGR